VLASTTQSTSLATFSIKEGFEENRRGLGTIRVGVDASIWMNEVQAALGKVFLHAQAGPKAELRVLFLRLAHLLQFAITPIFVFDGPMRPAVKRGKQVIDLPHWLTRGFQKCIDAFGYYHHTAEAELAAMNQAGLIDIVVSTDVDMLVFGAKCVIRSLPTGGISDMVDLITDESIQASTSLTWGGLALIAILKGGDYHKGLKECGIGISSALAKTGLGDSLLTAVRTYDDAALSNFLTSWRNELRQELQYNRSGLLQRRHPVPAKHVTNTFLTPDILRLYCRPITSWTQNQEHILIAHASSWTVGTINLQALAHIAEQSFEWEQPKYLLDRFRSHIFPGLCIRELMKANSTFFSQLTTYYSHGYIIDGPFSLSSVMGITSERQGMSGNGYRLDINTCGLVNEALSGLTPSARVTAARIAPRPRKLVWVPAPIVQGALPALVQSYINNTHHGGDDDV
ncbi:PIN domain-like protein, partial [Pluteus cervinus]